MKKKNIFFISLFVFLLFSFQVHAQSKNNATGQNQDQGVNQESGQGVMLRDQDQLRVDAPEAINAQQNQEQNQVSNQGAEKNLRQQERESNGTTTSSSTASSTPTNKNLMRRSQVANAVQLMLQVADRNGGIGQQVKTIAQSQNQNQIKAEESLLKVQKRGSFSKFLIGPNYGEIKKAEEILAKNREQITQLNQIMNQLSNQGDKKALKEQIAVLEQANTAIANDLQKSQKGFSLLGWLFKMFN